MFFNNDIIDEERNYIENRILQMADIVKENRILREENLQLKTKLKNYEDRVRSNLEESKQKNTLENKSLDIDINETDKEFMERWGACTKGLFGI